MSPDSCAFLELIKRRQRACWYAVLAWWVGTAAFIAVVSGYFDHGSDLPIYAAFYGSALMLYIPAIQLYKTKCPFCGGAAGALPIFRYTFLRCKSCGERIECQPQGSRRPDDRIKGG